MYAIMGLNRLGLFEEARQALTFCLRADAGQYVGYRFTDGKEYGVGVPYQVSVCRYFGTGKEESDFNEAGPNIELDGFGLFLVAYCDFVRRSGDMAFFNETFAGVSAKVADAIVHCIAEDDVIRIDSGPWERHLPGKQFAYTTIACAAGLRDFSDLCRNADRSEAEKYGQAYHRLMNGIRKCLVVDERFIKANVEAGDPAGYDYFDGGTFEAFGFGLFMDRSFFYSHLKEYEEALRIPGPRRGFSRVNKGDWYETAEWIFLDLRITSALDKFGGRATARRLLDWVTDQASLNFGLIPELYDEKTAAYDGAIPMVGYGAGVYVMTLFDLYE
jgi:GH15 family glucan-1,4-alpha-glucosidase